MLMTPPKEIRENIARAKGYLRREDIVRAMENMALALRAYSSISLARTARFELQVHFDEFLDELCRHPRMCVLLDVNRTGKPKKIQYQKGKEALLATVLEGLIKILVQAEEDQVKKAKESSESRLKDLISTGLYGIKNGEYAKGRAFLKRAASEFGHQPGVLMDIGKQFLSVDCHIEAAEIFEMEIDREPKNAAAYAAAIDAYEHKREMEKAEAIYMKIFRQFGGHAKTYGRLALMYLKWGKRSKAEQFAMRALQLDSKEANALQVDAALNHRNK